MSVPEQVEEIMLLSGYSSVYSFAKAIGEDPNNVNKNLKGIKKLTVPKLLKYAKALKLTAEQALWLFYPEEMKTFKKGGEN